MTRRAYLGDLEEIVLLAVARCEPEAYGMRIRQEIETQTGRSLAIGAVYASIERLEDKGYIKPVQPPAGSDRDLARAPLLLRDRRRRPCRAGERGGARPAVARVCPRRHSEGS